MPILILASGDREADVVDCLEAGADDYLVRPVGLDELLARMRRSLRHLPQDSVEPAALHVGSMCIDLARRRVTCAGAEAHVTPIEYKILQILAKHAGKVVSHRQILEQVWGISATDRTHYVRVHMAELRKKVERDPAHPQRLVTEPGLGYSLMLA